MRDAFFKFPSTPHLATLPSVEVRDDKVFTTFEREEFLQHEITVEEKVDGANLGISFDGEGNIRVQNRGSYLNLPGLGQWKKLNEWLVPHTDALFEHLYDRYILFGEWCYARHSIYYDQLPDWFLAFDIYDRVSQRFLSSVRRDRLINEMSLFKVPNIGHGHFSFAELKGHLSQSKLADKPTEGLYLRFDEGNWLGQRAKLVRPAFIQAVEDHWSRYAIQPNRLRLEAHR